MTSSIRYVVGDAVYPIGPRGHHKIIAHVCNDVGVWGAGFVLSLSARWPTDGPEDTFRYLFSCRAWQRWGDVQFWCAPADEPDAPITVANMIAMDGLRGFSNRRPLVYGALDTCLDLLRKRVLMYGSGTTVHMPRIGAGLAGGDWGVIEEMIQKQLVDRGVAVTVYDLPQRVDNRRSRT